MVPDRNTIVHKRKVDIVGALSTDEMNERALWLGREGLGNGSNRYVINRDGLRRLLALNKLATG